LSPTKATMKTLVTNPAINAANKYMIAEIIVPLPVARREDSLKQRISSTELRFLKD
jgi:hypothetical protein